MSATKRDECVLAVDCGTQSLRVLVFDATGELLDKRKIEYEPYVQTRPGEAEQDAEVYWNALRQGAREIASERPDLMARVRGVGVTTQRDSLVCLDANGDPLRPAILWLDMRKAVPPWRPGFPMKQVFALAGMGEAVIRTQEDGKLNWLAQNEPGTVEKAAKVTLISGFLNRRLTGEWRDSVASTIAHLAFDYKNLRWAPIGHRNRKFFPIDGDKLFEIVPPGTTLGTITAAASEATGIPAGLPVIACGSDKGCETVGMGVLDPSAASLSFGTTATVQTTSARYVEPLAFMPSYPAVVPGEFNPEVQIFRGYWMISWFKNQFAYREILEAKERGIGAEAMLNELLEKVPAGSHGLVMQPYWMPMLKMPSAKGAIIGFGDVHDRAHVYRAIIEGLAYGLREGLEKIERATGVRATRLTVSGGGSQSDEICRISANVFGLPISRGRTYEASGLGAAMATLAGIGAYPSVRDAIRALARDERVFEPEPAEAALYSELYRKVYKKMYRRLEPLYEAIRDVTNYPERV